MYIYIYNLYLYINIVLVESIPHFTSLWQAVVFTSQKHGKFPGFQSWLSPSESGLRLTSQVHHGLDGCQAELCHRLQGFGPLQAGAAKVEVDELQGLAHHADLTGADESLESSRKRCVWTWKSVRIWVVISYDIHMFHVLSNLIINFAKWFATKTLAVGQPAQPAQPHLALLPTKVQVQTVGAHRQRRPREFGATGTPPGQPQQQGGSLATSE